MVLPIPKSTNVFWGEENRVFKRLELNIIAQIL